VGTIDGSTRGRSPHAPRRGVHDLLLAGGDDIAEGRGGRHAPSYTARGMTETPADRIEKLLLRADGTLESHVAGQGDTARIARARRTLEEARDVARDPDVPQPVRDLVQRRLDGLGALERPADGPAAA